MFRRVLMTIYKFCYVLKEFLYNSKTLLNQLNKNILIKKRIKYHNFKLCMSSIKLGLKWGQGV